MVALMISLVFRQGIALTFLCSHVKNDRVVYIFNRLEGLDQSAYIVTLFYKAIV